MAPETRLIVAPDLMFTDGASLPSPANSLSARYSPCRSLCMTKRFSIDAADGVASDSLTDAMEMFIAVYVQQKPVVGVKPLSVRISVHAEYFQGMAGDGSRTHHDSSGRNLKPIARGDSNQDAAFEVFVLVVVGKKLGADGCSKGVGFVGWFNAFRFREPLIAIEVDKQLRAVAQT